MLFDPVTWIPHDCKGFIGRRLLGDTDMADRILTAPPADMREHDDWYQYLTPTRDQGDLDQCLGKALAVQATALYRRHLGKDVFGQRRRISGYKIWAHARTMFYNGKLDGGLTMEQGIEAAQDLRLYPPDTVYERIEPTGAELLRALDYSPVVQGTWTWHGWRKPHPLSGYVGRMDGFGGGHATTVVAIDSNDGYWTPVLENSWGEFWGRFGFGTLTLQQFEAVQLARPLAIRLPELLSTPPAELIE